MSRLAPAIRLRRRELDALALSIAAEQQRLDALQRQSCDLADQRSSERLLAPATPCATDAWFGTTARQLQVLAGAQMQANERLAALRLDALHCRARLQLLEEAQASTRKAEARRARQRVQTALDDRTAALWGRMP